MTWKNALIIGASGGIGQALSQALDCTVTEVSRSKDGLDVTNPGSIARVLDPLAGPFDLILITTGALEINGATPEKSLAQVSAEAMADQFAVNAIGPALILKHVARLCARNAPATVATLTARVGSITDNHLGGWYSYRAAKAAANQIIRTASIELARTHKHLTCVAIHPGTVATKFTEKYVGKHPAVPPQEAAQNILTVLSGLTPENTGQFYDWSGQEVAW